MDNIDRLAILAWGLSMAVMFAGGVSTEIQLRKVESELSNLDDTKCPRYASRNSTMQEVMAAHWSCVSDVEIAEKVASNFQRDARYARMQQEHPGIAARLEDAQSIYVMERDVILAEAGRRQANGHHIFGFKASNTGGGVGGCWLNEARTAYLFPAGLVDINKLNDLVCPPADRSN